MQEQKVIYRLNDKISFRKCSLFGSAQQGFGDCTNFEKFEEHFKKYYRCKQNGIHLHCTKHPEIEFSINYEVFDVQLKCPKCGEPIEMSKAEYTEIIRECLRLINIPLFKDAKMVRLDDWYIPELKEKPLKTSDYWIKPEIKTDKDGDTIIVLYVGLKGHNEKAQFFIKPEKLQLSSDFKDLDPATVLSKIEVTLRNRVLTQEYNSDDE